MLLRLDLEELLARAAASPAPVLSVYLDVDQSRATNRKRGFETTLKNLLQSVADDTEDPDEERHFAAAAARAQAFIEGFQPAGRSLVVVCDEAGGLFWHRELQIARPSGVFWGASPQVLPLLEAMDEFERYGVVVTDRARARLFTVYLGEIEEHETALADADVQHFKATGSHELMSQARFQRRSDEHASRHLRRVAGRLDELSRRHDFDRVVLAGPLEVVRELARLLPKRLRGRVIGSTPLSVEAKEQEILEKTMDIESERERRDERDLVEELLTAAAKRDQADAGVAPVLAALQRGRVLRLIYAEGSVLPGRRCRACSALLAAGAGPCDHCRGDVEQIDDLVSQAAQRTLETGAEVEHVRGEAAERLRRECEGIGAFLRF